MVRNQDVYFIGAVYIPPSKSKRELAQRCITRVGRIDILKFRKMGKVIIIGDFNCRFGKKESIIVACNKQFTFNRSTHDMDTKSTDASRGAFWLNR